jgi:hypothetical protein
MDTRNNVGPLKETLARVYGLSAEDGETRFGIGRIYGFRSKIMHEGATPSISGQLLDYLDAVYRDVLFERLGLKCQGAAEALRKQQGFDLRALLGQA